MGRADITINQRGADRIRSGHLWIYRSDVKSTGNVEGGSLVSVRDERRNYIGQALYSDRSEISLRMLTSEEKTVDREWWRQRFIESANRRKEIAISADAYRMVYSEGDLLPSLIVDRYKDIFVIQTLSQGTESLKETIVEVLVEEFHPRAVVERNDVRVRLLEGLEFSLETRRERWRSCNMA
jgi:23S rRNA (cytosine1962-C5)-methyltransferase